MEYITVAQLSERWQVTPRYIQKLCRENKLAGTVRFGRSWMIPEDVNRPGENEEKCPDEDKAVCDDEICWSVLGATYHTPGTADLTINRLENNPEAQMLTKAQFAYLNGNTAISAELSEKLFEASESFEIKIGAAFLIGICAMYNGNVNGWLRARTLIEKLPCPDNSYISRKEMWLAIFGASIYDMAAYTEWFRLGRFDSLPLGYFSAAGVHYAKYIYIRGDDLLKNQPTDTDDFTGQLFLLPAVCEPLISYAFGQKAIVPEIYLRLICASGYHHAGNDKLASEHINCALKLALPDKIYAPFAEQRLNLDSLLDGQIRAMDIKAFYEIKALNRRLINGWTVVHNTVLNRTYTTKLTAKEFEAARLAVFGLTNKDIAVRMKISVNSVKYYLQSAKEKTGVEKRSELAKFL